MTDDGMESALRRLDQEPDIAAFFRDIGVKGRLNDPTSCPVARWLTRESGLDGVCVTPTLASHADSEELFDLPISVAMFVREFDECYHPEFEED